jgi:hypothetical protein
LNAEPKTLTCPHCLTDHPADEACPICSQLEKVRQLAKTNRRSYAIQKAQERDRLPYKDE